MPTFVIYTIRDQLEGPDFKVIDVHLVDVPDLGAARSKARVMCKQTKGAVGFRIMDDRNVPVALEPVFAAPPEIPA